MPHSLLCECVPKLVSFLDYETSQIYYAVNSSFGELLTYDFVVKSRRATSQFLTHTVGRNV